MSASATEHKDPALEQLLTEHQIPWQLQWEKVSAINWEETEAQQIRQEPLDPDVIERYRSALEGGAIFPAVLAVRTGTSKIVLLGGIHRGRAYEAESRDKLPAYVIPKDTPGSVRYQLAIEHNAYHGMPLSQDERINHAARLLEEHGLTQAEVAKRVGLSQSMISRVMSARNSDERALQLGLTLQWKKLSASSQWRIGAAAADDDEVFSEAVLVARNCRLNSLKCYELATLISTAMRTGGPQEALQVIEDFEMENRPEKSFGVGNGTPSPIGIVRRSAVQILDLSVDATVADCKKADAQLTVEMIKRLVKRCGEIGAKLEAKARA